MALDTVEERETKAGNYFVSNYPPYSFWRPEHVGEVHAALARPPAADTPLGIYLHILSAESAPLLLFQGLYR